MQVEFDASWTLCRQYGWHRHGSPDGGNVTRMRIDGVDEELRHGTVQAPDLCRITILAQRTQVDLALPVNVPLALLIPGIVDMVTAHVRNNEFETGAEEVEPHDWVLAAVGRPPLDSASTLDELGVRDGELLMLENADHIAPPPLFDDIMHNVALADVDRYRRFSPALAHTLAFAATATLIVTGCFTLLWDGVGSHWSAVAGAGALLVSLVALVSGIVLGRMYHDRPTATLLCGCSLPPAFTAGALFVPGSWSWSRMLVGAVLAGAFAVLTLRVASVGYTLCTAVTTLAVFAVPTSIVGMFTAVPDGVICAVAAAAALGTLALAPRLSMLLAQLPLPPVPTAGSSIDPTEADPSDNHALPSLSELNTKAIAAHRFLSGLVAATTVIAVAGSLAGTLHTVDARPQPYWPGITLAVILAIVILFRGRTYAKIEETVILLAGGGIMVAALLVGAVVLVDSIAVAGVTFVLAALLALGALVLGVIAPHRTAPPPVRRAMEFVEYGFIAAVVPLTCWVAQLYSAIRGL